MTQVKPFDLDRIGKDALVELTNARFVDVNNGCFFDPETRIIMQGNQIVAMPGQDEETEDRPPDFTPDVTVDLGGKTVLPGLFNVHCHIQIINPTLLMDMQTIKAKRRFHTQQVEKAMADCMERGVTHVRDAFTDDLRRNYDLKERIERGDIPGPRIQQAVMVGPLGSYLIPDLKGVRKIFLGLMGIGKIKYADNHSGAIAFAPDADQQTVRDAVDRAIDERGADLIKVGESLEVNVINKNPVIMSMQQMETITDQARKRGVKTTIHSVSVATFQRAVKAGFSSLAHMARDGELGEKDVEACLRSGTIIDPTMSVGYDMSWKLKGDVFAEDPNMDTMYQFRNSRFNALAQEFWTPELTACVVRGFEKANQGRYKALGFIDLSKTLTPYSRIVHFGVPNTRRLLDAGATIACGNDGGIQSCTPAMINHELAILDLFMNQAERKKVFDGAAALKAATINSACSMGIDNQFGSLEKGKIADIVVVDGNPFEDISVIGKPVDALFMDGRLKINKCGLGLAISHAIITKHGGHRPVASAPGQDTTFTIYLPASADQTIQQDKSATETKITQKLKILVMDDEAGVRDILKTLLNKMGHGVILAEEGRKAIDIYQEAIKCNQPFDLIIMDLTISGGMGGKEAIREIITIDPKAKVIVSSGYSNDPIMANFRDYGFSAAIAKPYKMSELINVITQLLDA